MTILLRRSMLLLAVLCLVGLLVGCDTTSATITPTYTITPTPRINYAPPSTNNTPTPAPLLTAAPLGGDFEGTYDITGTNLDGSTYDGSLEITFDGDTYKLHWETKTLTDGIGIEYAGRLAVAYPADSCVVAVHDLDAQILKGLSLGEESTTLDVGQMFFSDAGPSIGSGLVSFSGIRPDGSVFEGGLSRIPKSGDHKQQLTMVRQWIGDDKLVGTGVTGEDRMVTAMGLGKESGCGVVIYERDEDGTLNGLWGILVEHHSLGGNGTDIGAGRETAVKK
jgi:hypothetical protein